MNKLFLALLLAAAFCYACWLILRRKTPPLSRRTVGHGIFMVLTLYFMGWMGADAFARENSPAKGPAMRPSMTVPVPAPGIVDAVEAAWRFTRAFEKEPSPDAEPVRDALLKALERNVAEGRLSRAASEMLMRAYNTYFQRVQYRNATCYVSVLSLYSSDEEFIRERGEDEFRKMNFYPDYEPERQLLELMTDGGRLGSREEEIVRRRMEYLLLSFYINDVFSYDDPVLLWLIKKQKTAGADREWNAVVQRAFGSANFQVYLKAVENADMWMDDEYDVWKSRLFLREAAAVMTAVALRARPPHAPPAEGGESAPKFPK